jgi:hypothetical protein
MYAQVREVKLSSDEKKARCPETQDKKSCYPKIYEVMRRLFPYTQPIAFIHCFMSCWESRRRGCDSKFGSRELWLRRVVARQHHICLSGTYGLCRDNQLDSKCPRSTFKLSPPYTLPVENGSGMDMVVMGFQETGARFYTILPPYNSWNKGFVSIVSADLPFSGAMEVRGSVDWGSSAVMSLVRLGNMEGITGLCGTHSAAVFSMQYPHFKIPQSRWPFKMPQNFETRGILQKVRPVIPSNRGPVQKAHAV